MYSSSLSSTSALDGVGGQHHAPAALPPGKTRYPLYRRLGGPQGRSGRVRKISPPPGFDPRTVQPVASRYTDWAIPGSIIIITIIFLQWVFKDWRRMCQMLPSKYLVHVGLYIHIKIYTKCTNQVLQTASAFTVMRRCHSKFCETWSGCIFSLTVELHTDLFGNDMEIVMKLAEDVWRIITTNITVTTDQTFYCSPLLQVFHICFQLEDAVLIDFNTCLQFGTNHYRCRSPSARFIRHILLASDEVIVWCWIIPTGLPSRREGTLEIQSVTEL